MAYYEILYVKIIVILMMICENNVAKKDRIYHWFVFGSFP